MKYWAWDSISVPPQSGFSDELLTQIVGDLERLQVGRLSLVPESPEDGPHAPTSGPFPPAGPGLPFFEEEA